MFVQNKSVGQSLEFFPPFQLSPLKTRILAGMRSKKEEKLTFLITAEFYNFEKVNLLIIDKSLTNHALMTLNFINFKSNSKS